MDVDGIKRKNEMHEHILGPLDLNGIVNLRDEFGVVTQEEREIQPWARHVSDWGVWPKDHPNFISVEHNTVHLAQAIREVSGYRGQKGVLVPAPTPDKPDGIELRYRGVSEGSFVGGQLLIGPGYYEINDTIDLSEEGDLNVNIHLIGTGVTSTTIGAEKNNGVIDYPLFIIGPNNSTRGSANHRGVIFEKFTLNGGTIGLQIGANDSSSTVPDSADPDDDAFNSTTAYNRFIDLEFWQQSEWSVHVDRAQVTSFARCNIRSTYNALKAIGVSSLSLVDCVIGETAGAIVVENSRVLLSGCQC